MRGRSKEPLRAFPAGWGQIWARPFFRADAVTPLKSGLPVLEGPCDQLCHGVRCLSSGGQRKQCLWVLACTAGTASTVTLAGGHRAL